MARYITKVRTDRSTDDAFAYMADLRHFADWDPGVRKVVQIEGDGAGPDAVFDVTVANGGRDLTLRYRTVEYRPSATLLVVARSALFTSEDRVTVVADGSGSIVTYDAQLRFNGLLRLADPALRPLFRRIGDKAAAGLRRVLDGVRVA
jgi:hypothetical protein